METQKERWGGMNAAKKANDDEDEFDAMFDEAHVDESKNTPKQIGRKEHEEEVKEEEMP